MAEAAADPVIPRDGLSLTALHAFVAEHTTGEPYRVTCGATGGKVQLPLAALTTAQVVEAIVKVHTVPQAQADAGGGAGTYVQLLQQRAGGARGLVAPATHFVSHAWTYRFADLLAALDARADAADAYFWIGAAHSRVCFCVRR